MTVQVIQMFPPTPLGESPVTLYTAPPGGVVLGRARVRFTNTDSAAHAVTAYGVPSGSTPGPTNTFLPGISIAATSNLDVDVPVLASSGEISAFTDAPNVIVAHAMDGVLFSP